MGIKETPEFKHDVKRNVSQGVNVPPPPSVDGALATEEEYDDIIDRMKDLVDKSNRLHAAIKEMAKKTSVPVDAAAVEVRAAVASLDKNQPDGAFINFDLYEQLLMEETLDYDEDQILEFAQAIKGIHSIDSKAVSILGGRGDINPLLDYAKHLGVLLLASNLMAGFNSMHTQKQTSTKQPVGTELGGIAFSWGVTLALMYAIHKMEGKDPKEMLESLGSDIQDALKSEGIDQDEIMRQGEAYAEDLKNTQYGKTMTQSNSNYIVGYTDDYISHSEDPGYTAWIACRDTIDAANDMKRSVDGALKYTSKGLPLDVYKLFNCRTMGTNDRLDMLASVLYSKLTADMVCCFVRMLGSKALDVKKLKLLRAMLGFLAKGPSININSLMKRLSNNLKKKLGKALLEPIFHQIRRFFKNTAKDIRDWLDSDEEKWKDLFACTPIDDLFEYLLKALKEIEKTVFDLLEDIWLGVQFKHVNWKHKIGNLADKFRLNQLLKIIDAVIKAINRGILCNVDGTRYPSDDELREMTRLVLDDLPDLPSIGLERTGNPYTDFNSTRVTTPLGIVIPGVRDAANGKFSVDDISPADCLKRLTDENVIPLRESIPMEVTRYVQQFGEEF